MAKNEEGKFQDGVKKMTTEEIGIELKTLRDRLYTLRSKAVTEKVEDVSHFGITRRNIARLMTEQNARRSGGAGAPSVGAARKPAPKKVAAAPKAAVHHKTHKVHKTAKPHSAGATKKVTKPSAVKPRPSARSKSAKSAKAAK